MADDRSDSEVLKSIDMKLDMLVSISLMQGKTQDEQIVILRNRGFEWGMIGSLVGLKADAARKRYKKTEKAEQNGKEEKN